MSKKKRKGASSARGLPHVGRSEEQKRAYFDEVIRGMADLTSLSPFSPEGASTASLLTPEPAEAGEITETPSRTPRQKPTWWEGHKTEVVKGVVVAMVVAVLTGIAAMLFNMNREVGEVREELKASSSSLQNFKKESFERHLGEFERFRENTGHSLDKHVDKLSSIVERLIRLEEAIGLVRDWMNRAEVGNDKVIRQLRHEQPQESARPEGTEPRSIKTNGPTEPKPKRAE